MTSFELVKVKDLVAFSDAIFAFSITFMAVSITLPEFSSTSSNNNSNANSEELMMMNVLINNIYPRVVHYIVSFLVVALYWIGFHRTFNYIHLTNGILIWLTLIFLLIVTFISFTTAMVVDYGNSTLVWLIYIMVLSSTGFLLTSIFYYAFKAKLMVRYGLEKKEEEQEEKEEKKEDILSPDAIKYNILRSIVPPVVFISTIPIAFIDPTDTSYAWLIMVPILFLLRRRWAKNIR